MRKGQRPGLPLDARVGGLEPQCSKTPQRDGRPPFWERPSLALPDPWEFRCGAQQVGAVGRAAVNANGKGITRRRSPLSGGFGLASARLAPEPQDGVNVNRSPSLAASSRHGTSTPGALAHLHRSSRGPRGAHNAKIPATTQPSILGTDWLSSLSQGVAHRSHRGSVPWCKVRPREFYRFGNKSCVLRSTLENDLMDQGMQRRC
jgi:hypothetical protein